MDPILVYADSLSWGIIPGTRERLSFEKRWPGMMEAELHRQSFKVRVIEDCLNGRRTCVDDPSKPGRNGLIGIEQRIEVNSPLSIVIVFLGTNDFQSVHQIDARQSAKGLASIVSAIRRAPIEPGMPVPEILLVAPPKIQSVACEIAKKFEGAEQKAVGLADAVKDIADEMKCEFFDAATVTKTSNVDGVHLDAEQHRTLGHAISARVIRLLERI
ncbi:SGNH/GDSL hydrolase family protein [Rubripirellula amarantea]|nr:SGNH/GDSL hydrolase family protein [Rubripirellula amarantea]